MSENHLPNKLPSKAQLLQHEIDVLLLEISDIKQKTLAFENVLRAKIEDELIQEQELSILYKQQKKAKKDKRWAQKKCGKKYQEQEAVQITKSIPLPEKNSTEQLQKKRLYREAMVQVHPDKFSMQKEKLEFATEITAQLIETYQSGDLMTLQAYHAHIFNGNTSLQPIAGQALSKDSGFAYMQMELTKLREELSQVKNRQTYKVLTEYENPMTFVDELKSYYKDRLNKLRKRTRTK